MSSKAVLTSRIPEITAEVAVKLDEVAEAGAKLIEASAKDNVEVDSGLLRDRIHVEKEGTGKYAVVAGDREAFYGHLLEDGTTHSAPHPFLIPALEEDKPEILALGAAALKAAT